MRTRGIGLLWTDFLSLSRRLHFAHPLFEPQGTRGYTGDCTCSSRVLGTLHPHFHPRDYENRQTDERDDVSDYAIDRRAKTDVYIIFSGRERNDDQAGNVGLLRFGGLAVYHHFPCRIAEKAHSDILRCGGVDREVFFRLPPRENPVVHWCPRIVADEGQILVQFVGVVSGGDVLIGALVAGAIGHGIAELADISSLVPPGGGIGMSLWDHPAWHTAGRHI